MMDTLHLTSSEEKIFSTLSEKLREGWKMQSETLNSYETPTQLKMRMHMSALKKYPFFERLAKKVQSGESIDTLETTKQFPEEVLPQVFFLIGARGMTLLIEDVLSKADSDDALMAIAAWSEIRHDLLLANAA